MKNVIFDERRDIEYVIESREVTQDNVNIIIASMAKYNLYVKSLNDDESYEDISEWLKVNYNLYIETEFDGVIRKKIKAAHKYKLLYSDDINIYQNELDTISSVNDIRIEKVLFVLLCIAKLQRNMFGYKNGKYKFALTNIFKLARVHIPSTDRGIFIHGLLEKGFIGAPFINSDDSRWINFMCEEGSPVITVSELDFEEIAYVYLNWKNGGGYDRCANCGRIVRHQKNRKYCIECSKYQPVGDKIIACVDCGKEIIVGAKNNETCRCEECNKKYRNEYMKDLMREKRKNNKSLAAQTEDKLFFSHHIND